MTNRMQKHRALQKKLGVVGTEGGPSAVHTDIIAVEYPDGFIALQRWTGEQWETVRSGHLK